MLIGVLGQEGNTLLFEVLSASTSWSLHLEISVSQCSISSDSRRKSSSSDFKLFFFFSRDR